MRQIYCWQFGKACDCASVCVCTYGTHYMYVYAILLLSSIIHHFWWKNRIYRISRVYFCYRALSLQIRKRDRNPAAVRGTSFIYSMWLEIKPPQQVNSRCYCQFELTSVLWLKDEICLSWLYVHPHGICSESVSLPASSLRGQAI